MPIVRTEDTKEGPLAFTQKRKPNFKRRWAEAAFLTRRLTSLVDVEHSSTYVTHMKAIQITLDERLLARLDADAEVKRDGRSAVIRRAAIEYLRKKRRTAIAHAYRRGYGNTPDDFDFHGWADEGAWPEK